MDTYVLILKVEVPQGIGQTQLNIFLNGANVTGYGDNKLLAQVVKVVDVVKVAP